MDVPVPVPEVFPPVVVVGVEFAGGTIGCLLPGNAPCLVGLFEPVVVPVLVPVVEPEDVPVLDPCEG